MKRITSPFFFLFFFLICTGSFGQNITIPTEENPDNIKDLKFMTPTELEQQFLSSQKLPAFTAVLNGLQKRGFVKLKMKEGNWGFTGEYKMENGIYAKSKFLAFDFYNPKAGKGGQGASIIMRQVGTSTYTAYIIFPEGDVSTEEAFTKGEEWYADAQNNLQPAKSWIRCFWREVRDDCKTRCIVRVAVCTALNAALGVATGGVSMSAAVAIFASCAGSYCAPCLARQALQCF
ncbi:MAG: hypothetical protein NWS66_08225 [Saprospiraceae bacterium]|nr:hypothetical protein [Saprospiraceae bacterium]MDP4810824.1 hypothetical protein [Saprospiraceae bacterium]MDP4915056.1 hypothetical protein [Saprospiraceae bacterium]MDP5047132.1 hypothetical protein [Saprospiraceae bacterium]MDP5091246.1 hypothetical protein [Saprospiraceae bacterium]